MQEGAGGAGFGTEPELHRDYEEEELWDNFTSFAREVAPVAEEAGVRIGIHPDFTWYFGLGFCLVSTYFGSLTKNVLFNFCST